MKEVRDMFFRNINSSGISRENKTFSANSDFGEFKEKVNSLSYLYENGLLSKEEFATLMRLSLSMYIQNEFHSRVNMFFHNPFSSYMT